MTRSFLIFPNINPDKVFPPEVRQAFASSPEVQTAVENAVASEATVTNAASAAATTAVDGELLKKGVFTGAFQILSTDTIALTFADQAGNRSWVEIGYDGAPTPEAAAAIVSAISGNINSMIATAIAANPGSFKVINDGSGVRVAFVDSEDRRSWLEVGADGGPTPEAALAITSAISGNINSLIATEITTAIAAQSGIFKVISDGSGIRVAFIDSEDRRSWLEVGDDGGPTSHSISLIQGKLSPTTTADSAKVPYSNETIKIASGPDFHLLGDSMTASGWGTTLATLTGRTVWTNGVGGESSVGIAARANAMPYLMLPVGGSIPASGGVEVTFTSAGGGQTWPLLQGAGGGGTMTGTLAGVAGTVTLVKGATPLPSHGSDDVYIFTRTTSGSVVSVTRPTAFYYTFGEAHRGDITVIWAGRNNWSTDNGDRAFRDIKAMTDYCKALDKRFLVLAIHNGAGEGTGTATYNGIMGINTRLMAEYGRRFVDHRTYIIQYGLADAGITPTSQDTADIAADLIPVSLRTDALHQNEAGKVITATQVNLRARELGWV